MSANQNDWRKSTAFKRAQPFFFGAMAGCTATCIVQPIDMVKVKLQTSGEGGKGKAVKNPFIMAKNIYQQHGLLSFYKGLSAALLRQITYGTARLGIFRTVSDNLKDDKGKITALNSAFAGFLAGGLGSMIGCPADVALVRMQTDNELPPNQRRNYKNVLDALKQIIKNDGVLSLWKGNIPTVTRAISLNMGQLSVYDQAKIYFTESLGPGTTTNVASAMVASFGAAFFSLPFDFVRVRIQKQKPGPDGVLPYKNSLDCCRKVIVKEGITTFYRGFGTYYIRIGPHAVVTLLVLESLNKNAKLWGWQ